MSRPTTPVERLYSGEPTATPVEPTDHSGRTDRPLRRADRPLRSSLSDYSGRDPDHPGYPGDHSDQYSANTPTEETNTPDNTPTNTPDVTKSNTPADNSSKIIPQTGVSSSNSNSVAGLAIVLVAALGGAAAYLFINRKKLN